MAHYNPVPVGPMAAAAQPPFLASQTAARLGRPVEPFAESMRLVLLVFGALLLIAFVTPTSTGPLAFHWNTVLDAVGKAKIGPLLIASAGLLGILMALIPLAYVGRAALAMVLGVAPIALAIALAGFFSWRDTVGVVGGVMVIAGLLIRNEYRNDLLPRIVVTVGVIGVLLPLLLPVEGTVPLVNDLRMFGSGPPIAMKINVALDLVATLLAVAALMAWLPGPSTAGAKVLAWLLVLYPLAHHLVKLVVKGGIGAEIKASPFDALLSPIPGIAYVAFAAIGLAAILGKQLERR
jgi:hypothetical protein